MRQLGTEILSYTFVGGTADEQCSGCYRSLSDLESRRQLKRILDGSGIDTICSYGIRECQEILASRDVDLIFCDSSLANGTYRDLLRTLQLADRKMKVVVTSRRAGWEEFLEAARLGAFDMIATPCVPTEVEWVISQLVRVLRNERQAARLDTRAPEVQLHS